MKTEENYSLKERNTFGIDVCCRRFVEYETEEELAQYVGLRDVLHIGGGSNLLFLSNYDGTVLHSGIHTLEHRDEGEYTLVRVGAATVWDDLVAYTIAHGWYGLENLSLIPGEVGASAVQNIGAYGVEAKDYIAQVECLHLKTGERRTFSNEECRYAYRHSLFKTPEHRGQWAVLYVTYRLSRTFVPKLDYGGIRIELERNEISQNKLSASDLRKIIIEIRQTKLPDPKVQGNAGSFFMNPIVERCQYEALAHENPGIPHYEVDAGHVKIPAGWLIEQCGWKGRALGCAAVHDRQALVLVNRGGATGSDIVRLCNAIRKDVRKHFGIDLHPEVNFIGSLPA